MQRHHIDVFLLALSQAIFMSTSVIAFTYGGLAGTMLAPDPAWGTVPLAMIAVGAGISTVPAALLMRRYGRKSGFFLGILSGVIGGALGYHAIVERDFWLFCIAFVFMGFFRAFSNYYRFAAIDVAPESWRARAVSYVLAGGVVAAVVGPYLALWGNDLFEPITFAGAYVVVAALGILGFLPMALTRLPKAGPEQRRSGGRRLSVIARTPAFQAALANGVGGYSLMVLTMTATPVYMVACGFAVSEASSVVQWHVVAMYLPSFFTGALIARFGLPAILATGMVLFAATVAVAVEGIAFANFSVALVLLGVAWNLSFVGGTALLPESCTPEERPKVEAFNEFVMFAVVSLASAVSGGLLNLAGWNVVNLVAIPVLAVMAFATLRWVASNRREAEVTPAR